MLTIITNTKALIMNKKRCPNCHTYNKPDDKGVKLINARLFCDEACMFSYVNNSKIKAKSEKKIETENKKIRAVQKRTFYANDLKTRKAAAKKACHLYIRTRDADRPCICCGRALGEKFDAGHFIESGNNPKIRYDADNIHAQSVYCNQYKGGNSDDYEGNLRKKIGDERVDRLLSLKSGTMKRTAQDYTDIENKYKQLLKELLQ